LTQKILTVKGQQRWQGQQAQQEIVFFLAVPAVLVVFVVFWNFFVEKDHQIWYVG
jgi:hypothetical protein